MGPMHPESPARTTAVLSRLQSCSLRAHLQFQTARPACGQDITLVHSQTLYETLKRLSPTKGLVDIDPDTRMGPDTLAAAHLAAGIVVQAVDAIAGAETSKVFCNVRPPGHHAEWSMSMGFCLFNNIAVGVRHAQAIQACRRVAILDFDVHHGNGTVDIFKDDPDVLVCSSFQHPFFPLRYHDIVRPNIVNCPLPKGSDGDAFRQVVESRWLPALNQHRPEWLFVSAGFDAHRDDPLGGLCFTEADFHWIGQLINEQAGKFCSGRVVSVLEGGYELSALASSVESYLSAQC